MDNVQVLGDDLQDIVRMTSPAGTLRLPLEPCSTEIARPPSLASAPGPVARTGLCSGSWSQIMLRSFGFIISPIFSLTIQLSWDYVLSGMERIFGSWRTRRLETLPQRVQAPEVFILTKAWFVGHLLPFATRASRPDLVAPATCFRRIVSNFLWAGHSGGWLLMPSGYLAASASPALRPGPRPCWPSRPAITWPPGPPSSLLARHQPPGIIPWDGLCFPHGGRRPSKPVW
jgi:hypothetical protein